MFVETLVVVDKSVRDRFDTDDEVKRYVEVLLSLVSQVLVLETLVAMNLACFTSYMFS